MNKQVTGKSALSQPSRVPGSTPAGFEGLKVQIVELRRTGAPFTKISSIVGISVYLVKRALVEMGVQETPFRSVPYKLNIPKERVEELVALGRTRFEMESILGISGRSVLTLLARYGLQAGPSHHINKVLIREGRRRCSECREIKLLATEFYNQTGSPGGKGYRCKTCSRNWLKFAQQRAGKRDLPSPTGKAGGTT